METMAVYLGLVAANTSATATVYWDTVESTTDATGVETTAETTAQGDVTVILALTAEVATAAKGEIAGKRAFIIDVSKGGTLGMKNAAGASLIAGSTASAGGSATINTNLDLLIADLKSAANVARFSAYDLTVDAARGGDSSQTVSLVLHVTGVSTATQIGQRWTTGAERTAAVSATNYGFGADDYVTFTVGSNSVTATGADLAAIKTAIMANWAAKYGYNSGTASASAIATLTTVNSTEIKVTALDRGTAGYGLDVDITATAGTVTASNGLNVGWRIGTTILESDDATVDENVVLTILSDDKGTLLDKTSGVTTNSSVALAWVELTTTAKSNATNPNAGIQLPAGQTADAVLAENGTLKVVTTAGQTKTRVHWLGN
jgi:hypothetical protein